MNFLPGWDDDFLMASQGILLTHISSTAANTATDCALTFPASGVEAGDLLIYFAGAWLADTDPPDVNVPSGFTEIRTDSATPGGDRAVRDRVYYKIAAGNEESTAVNISDDSSTVLPQASGLLQFRPSSPIGSVTIVDSAWQGTSGDPTAQTLGTGEEFSLHVGYWFGDDTIPSLSYTPTEDGDLVIPAGGNIPGDSTAYMLWKVMFPPAAAVPVTIDMGDEGSVNSMGSFILLMNAA